MVHAVVGLLLVVAWMVRFKNRYLVVVVHRVGEEDDAAEEGAGKRRKKRQRTAPAARAGGGVGGDADAWLTARELHAALAQSIEANFGEWALGGSLAALAVRYADAPSGVAIVRTARDALTTTRAALTFVTALRGGGVVAQVARVCGSMRTCRPAAVAAVRRRRAELGGDAGDCDAALRDARAAIEELIS